MEISAYFTEKHEWNCGMKGAYSEHSVRKVQLGAVHGGTRAFAVRIFIEKMNVQKMSRTSVKDSSVFTAIHTHNFLLSSLKSHRLSPPKDLQSPEDLLKKPFLLQHLLKRKGKE